MGKPKAPTPPDPKETAAAQTGTNLATAQANAVLGNVNQITPYGNLTYNQTGNRFVENDNGQSYWRGPNGEIQASAPMTTSGSTAQKVPIYDYSGGRDGGRRQLVGYRDEVVPGTSAPASGWAQVKGNYIPQYTAETSLSPSEQAKFDQSQAAQLNLLKLANQQSAFLQDYMGKPMDYGGIPAGGNAAELTMPRYRQFADGPSLQTGIASGGGIADGYDRGATIADSYDRGGAIQTGLGDAGQITRDFGPADGYAGNMQAVQDGMMKRLGPQMDQQRTALETQLANQGIRVGSDAYESAMRQLNQGQNDQRTSVVLAAGQEQSRLANLDAQRAGFQNAAQQQAYAQMLAGGQFANSAQAQQNAQNAALAQFGNAAQGQRNAQNAALAQFGNAAQQQRFGQNAMQAEFGNGARQQMFQNQNSVTAQNNALQDQTLNAQLARFNAQNQQRSQAMQEAYAQRQQPINEIIGLMGGAPIQQPNFVNTSMPTVPTVDYAGLVNENYNQRMGLYNQQMAQRQNLFGGLLGLGSSAIMASDRRVKKDITKRGRIDGTNIYAFRYRGEDSDAQKHLGVMAQEVEKTRPDAVIEVGGVKHVDYGKALPGLFGLGQKGVA
nr:MAG TPA: Neck appendage protein [Caudoviricetes sp.]DAK00511.1 MAG TPA: Neck appendage protein [Caudoviricetes sp.]